MFHNRVVSAYQPASTRIADLKFNDVLLSVDGEPVRTLAQYREIVGGKQAGSIISYRFLRPERPEARADYYRRGSEIARSYPVLRFSWLDFANSFGRFLFFSLVWLAVGVFVIWNKPSDSAARAFFCLCAVEAIQNITYIDLVLASAMPRVDWFFYGIRPVLYAELASFLPAVWRLSGLIGLAIRAGPVVWGVGYAIYFFGMRFDSGAVHPPAPESIVEFLGMTAFFQQSLSVGMALLFLSCLVGAFSRDRLLSAQALTMLAGIAVSYGPAVIWRTFRLFHAVPPFPISVPLYTFTLFPLFISFGILRRGLFDIGLLARRGATYTILVAGLSGAYLLLVSALGFVFPQDGRLANFFAAMVVAVLLAPARDWLKTWIDRLYFRDGYSYETVLETASSTFASLLDTDACAREMEAIVRGRIMAEDGCVFLRAGEGWKRAASWGAEVPDSPDACRPSDGATSPRSRPGSRTAGPQWLVFNVPAAGEPLGALVVGPKKSGCPYSERDLALLATVANQAAVAIRNSLAYEQLERLNEELEDKVEKRTAQLNEAVRNLREIQAQLIENEKASSLGRLVTNVAHEINNPVAMAIGGLHVVKRRLDQVMQDLAPSSRAREDVSFSLQAIQEGLERISGIVSDLLRFAGGGSMEPVGMASAVRSAIASLGERACTVTVELRGSPPEVLGDPEKLVLLVRHLLTNALEASGPTGSVMVTLTGSTGAVAVEVEDDGPGVAPAMRERIFEPFFTTKDPSKGTGLGLYLCREIARVHGGQIAVGPRSGGGAVFTVTLPGSGIPKLAFEDVPPRRG